MGENIRAEHMTNFEKISVIIAALAAFFSLFGIILVMWFQLGGKIDERGNSIREIHKEIGEIRVEIGEKIGEVEIRLESKIDKTSDRIDETSDRISKLNREIGELRGELRGADKVGSPPAPQAN